MRGCDWGCSSDKTVPTVGNKRVSKARRSHRVSIMLNDSEMRALQRYCDKYTITNRSKLIRETLMHNILKRFDLDNPTLFD